MDSSKIKIPTSTAPTAPMPVHTGYAVPKGNVCVAFANNKSPAKIKMIQFISEFVLIV